MADFVTKMNYILFFFSLSRMGRRFLLERRKISKQEGIQSMRAILSNSWERKLLGKNFKVCDKNFQNLIPKALASSVGRDRWRLYQRYIPFAVFNHALRTRIHEAFEIPYNRDAENRSVLMALIHREIDDLNDEKGYSYEVLISSFSDDVEDQKEFELLIHFWNIVKTSVPRQRFPKFYGLYEKEMASILAERDSLQKGNKKFTLESGLFAARIFLYSMTEDIPDKLEQTLPAFGLWLYALDDLADIEQDTQKKELNYMSTLDDPVSEIWNLFRAYEEQVRKSAPHPERILRFTEAITKNVVDSFKRGINIEDTFLNLDA